MLTGFNSVFLREKRKNVHFDGQISNLNAANELKSLESRFSFPLLLSETNVVSQKLLALIFICWFCAKAHFLIGLRVAAVKNVFQKLWVVLRCLKSTTTRHHVTFKREKIIELSRPSNSLRRLLNILTRPLRKQSLFDLVENLLNAFDYFLNDHIKLFKQP